MRYFGILLLSALLLCCEKPAPGFIVPLPGSDDDQKEETVKPEEQEPVTPTPPEEDEQAYLVTNPFMQAFMEEVTYRDGDNTYTLITGYPGGGPGVRTAWRFRR